MQPREDRELGLLPAHTDMLCVLEKDAPSSRQDARLPQAPLHPVSLCSEQPEQPNRKSGVVIGIH